MNQKITNIYHVNVNLNLMEGNRIQINGGILTNVDVSCKKCLVCDKDYIWNPSTYIYENGTHLASIIDYLAITFDEYMQSCDKETKTITTNFNEKKSICKTQNFYILLAFLLIAILLLRSFNIYCRLKKYQAKQKHLLPFHNTNNEL